MKFPALFEPVYNCFNRRPGITAAFFFIVAILAGIAMPLVPFEGGLEIMLPEGSEARRSVLFLRDADFADKAAFSLSLDDPAASEEDLLSQMAELEKKFEKSPLIQRVITFPDEREMFNHLMFFLDHFDELAGPRSIEQLKQRLDKQVIQEHIRKIYIRILQPEGSFIQPILRRDPLGISSIILQRIRELSQTFDYQVKLSKGRLIHPDGRHGLILLETGIPMTDTVGSRRLVAWLNKVQDDIPNGFQAEFVAGHQRTVSNEKLLRRDIRFTATVVALVFLALFFLVFRDFRAGFIFLVPCVSILISIHLASWIMGRLSYLIIGFGAVMAGIAVDYGIHVYVCRQQNFNPRSAIRGILRPILIGGLTTMSVFLAFLVSTVPGYRQLAGFAVISITLSILGAIFILPALLSFRLSKSPSLLHSNSAEGHKSLLTKTAAGVDNKISSNGSTWWAVFFWVALPATAFFAFQTELDTELSRLDGTTEEIKESEEHFQKIWGDYQENTAMAVVSGKDHEEAARNNDILYRKITKNLPEGEFKSLAAIWPSRRTRSRNQERWREFWTTDRINRVRRLINSAASEYGFSNDAFQPFFKLLAEDRSPTPEPIDNLVLDQLRSRFVQHHGDKVRIVSFFSDNPKYTKEVQAATKELPGSFIVSARRLGEALAESTAREAFIVAGAALVLILIVVFSLMAKLKMAIIALLPAASGVFWLLAFMYFTGLTVNIANMIAGIVVVGLGIDYGIFISHGQKSGGRTYRDTRKAVTLSAATSILGAASLLLARHPALFSIGITLTVGITAAFFAALLGVPATYRWLYKRHPGADPVER